MYKLVDFLDSDDVVMNKGEFCTVGSSSSENPKTLSFASNLKHLKLCLANDNVSSIITSKKMYNFFEGNKGVVVVDDPEILYGQIKSKLLSLGELTLFTDYNIADDVSIDSSASVSEKVKIGSGTVIGKNSIIHDNVIIGENVVIGDNVIIGCDGFYFKRNSAGVPIKQPHLGGVLIHDNVEIMSNSMVQRAHDLTYTTIGKFTKISVNCNIGHSCQIGERNMIAGNTQIAGRVNIADDCWIGTSSTISDSVNIGSACEIKIGSVVIVDQEKNSVVSGSFAIKHKHNIKDFLKKNEY